MELNAYQTLINQTANKRALSGEEQERLRQIAAQQGAAAASSLALQMAQQGATTQPAQQTAMPDYVAASKAKSAANQAIVNGATAGQSVQAQNAYQKTLANALPSVNVTLSNRNTSSGDPVSAATLKSLGTPQPVAAQPVEMKDYTWWNWMGDNNMTTMNDQDKANWNTAMQGWQNGDYSAFNDNFQTNGNWASYVDDKGNVNGMLRYVGDGVGGYVPVNNGMLVQNEGFSGDRNNYAFYGPDGSVYTADANGRLTKAGNWTMQEPYSALKDSIPYKLLKGTATDEERDKWFTQVDPSYPVRQAASNGDQEAQQQLALLAQAEAERSGVTPQNIPTQNAYQRTVEQATQTTPTQAQPIQNQPIQNQPIQNQPVQTQPTQASPNIYQQYMDQWDYPEAPQWENTEYQRQRDEALRRAQNLRFSYDPESDPVWQAYQKQYRREGQRAMQDTMAEAAMRTGGLANSYAVSAAAQAGNYYAAELSDRLPQLYNDAYQRYLAEFQRQLGISDQYAGFDQTEYGRYADELGQWNKDRSFDYGLYRDRVGDARYADELAYDRAWNEENRDYSRNYQAQRDAISDQRYDQEWAQQLREYADSQNWKATEWQQYLREYGDKMSQQEREWAYQQYRDAVEDQQYADQTAWQKAVYDQEYADQRKDKEWEQTYKQTTYNDALEDAALDYLNTNGIVTGRYAEILGVPDGTTYEQYYSRYLGGGNSSPFEETEIPSGTTPKYTPPPIDDGGDDEQPPDAPPQNDPVFQKIRSKYGEDTAMETWNLSNQPWFAKLKSVAYTNKNAALDEIYYRVEAGQISDDEMVIKALLDMLGLNEASVEYGAYGGSTGLYGTYGVKGGSNRNVNIQNLSN